MTRGVCGKQSLANKKWLLATGHVSLLAVASISVPEFVFTFTHDAHFLAGTSGEYKGLLQPQFRIPAHTPLTCCVQKATPRQRMCVALWLRSKSPGCGCMFGVTFLQKQHVRKQQKMLSMSEKGLRAKHKYDDSEKRNVSLTCCGTTK